MEVYYALLAILVVVAIVAVVVASKRLQAQNRGARESAPRLRKISGPKKT